jgi:hypothetical protein
MGRRTRSKHISSASLYAEFLSAAERVRVATQADTLLLKRDECADAGPLSAKLLKNGALKTYKGFPHGMPATQADTINADLLAFLKA